MLKLLGAVCVLLGAGGFGCRMTLQFHAQRRQLAALENALELLKCELNYTAEPLAAICRAVSLRVGGAIGSFFAAFAAHLSQNAAPSAACKRALAQTHGLTLPSAAAEMLPELFSGLGSYDLEGANRLLKLAFARLDALLAQTERERRPLARSYVLLALCAGAAIVILAV